MVKNQTIYNFELILSEKDFCYYNRVQQKFVNTVSFLFFTLIVTTF